MHVVATAGHVDHGKSTLVLALTGTDPDRWAEEKARGLTIDLGFAHCVLPSGRGISFVDVPGHVRFIKNMLAGVGAVDACLFVVAATEGWKPQSEEHLRILELLGLRHGLVALTKVGLCDDDLVELARLDVADHVGGHVPRGGRGRGGRRPHRPRRRRAGGGARPADRGDAGGGRPGPAPAVGRPGLRGHGLGDGGDRHARRRLAGRRRRAGAAAPGAGRCGSAACSRSTSERTGSGPGTAPRSTSSACRTAEVERGDVLVRAGQWEPDPALRRHAQAPWPPSTTRSPAEAPTWPTWAPAS